MADELLYVCPRCRGSLLLEKENVIRCVSCSLDFPIHSGIPDFRIQRDDDEGETERVKRLLDSYHRASFLELVELNLNPQAPDDLKELDVEYERRNVERGRERAFVISKLGFPVEGGELFLDLGCGTGGALAAFSPFFSRVVGVDISLPDLILARKLLDELSIDNAVLICASAEALPFPDDLFDLINATDVIEHIRDQKAFLREGYRVLRPGGAFCFNSPNRFNVFGPEPQVNLWWIGFLPRKLMKGYVKFRKGIEYSGIKLLSYREVKRMVDEVADSYEIKGAVIAPSSCPNSLKRRIAGKIGPAVEIANLFLKPLIPGYQIAVFKEGG